jgi:hypothetical protein
MGLSNSRSGAAGRRGLARAALLFTPLALAACGSVVAGSSGAAGSAASPTAVRAVQPGTLCADQGAVNHLVVTRTGIVNHVQAQRFAFPAVVTVTSPAQARAVAKALCALPPGPTGITNCPADLGISYQLRFAAGGRHFHVVTVASTGCELVSGAGKVRTISTAPGFWFVLGKTMRLHGPLAQKAFTGTPQGGKHCTPASTAMAQSANCPGRKQSG